MEPKQPNQTARTSLERVQRKIVDDAADELVAFLKNLPEHGSGATKNPDQSATRERILAAKAAVMAFLGES